MTAVSVPTISRRHSSHRIIFFGLLVGLGLAIFFSSTTLAESPSTSLLAADLQTRSKQLDRPSVVSQVHHLLEVEKWNVDSDDVNVPTKLPVLVSSEPMLSSSSTAHWTEKASHHETAPKKSKNIPEVECNNKLFSMEMQLLCHYYSQY